MSAIAMATASPHDSIVLTVFYDADRDTKRSPSERAIPDLAGLTPQISLEQIDDDGKLVLATAQFEEDKVSGAGTGTYRVKGLSAGNYVILFPQQVTLPSRGASLTLTTPSGRDEALSVSVRAQEVRSISFGYRLATSCISGRVMVSPTLTCASTTRTTTTGPAQRLPLPFGGVPVSLLENGVIVAGKTSGPTGEFEFVDLEAGTYSLEFPRTFQGRSLTLADNIVTIGFLPPGATFPLTYDILYNGAGARYVVSGRLLLQGGNPVRASVTLVALDASGNPKPDTAPQSASSDDLGHYAFQPQPEGLYSLSAPENLGGIGGVTTVAITATRHLLNVFSDVVVPDIVYETNAFVDAILEQVGGLRRAATSLVSTGTTAPALPAPALAVGAGGSVAYGQIVDVGLRQVLGAVPPRDSTRVLALLNRSFEQKTERGRVYYALRRNGAFTAIAGNGVLAGALASFHQEAVELQQSAERVLNTLEPTILEPDEASIAAAKDSLRTTLAAVVGELGRPEGPVSQRVQVLSAIARRDLERLRNGLGLNGQGGQQLDLDVATRERTTRDLELLEGQLGTGGDLDRIVSRAAASNLTGAQLARLSYVLDAIPLTLQDVITAMDAVNFGASDRRITPIGTANGTTNGTANSLTIEQLLLWIQTSASGDWPNRLATGATRVSDVEAVATESGEQLTSVQLLIRNLDDAIPVGSDRPRVALAELERELQQIGDLARGLASPAGS
jgi:hypothetical protein